MGAIRIGTAGWPIPASCRDFFPDHGSLLERYATRFNAVEINSSFYRPHRRVTYERWAASVPDHFSFAVKLPRTITHENALKNCTSEITRFAAEVAGLGPKLGTVLVQLPPSLQFQPDDARIVFEHLRAVIAAPLVCEPRHPDWFTRAAEDLMLELGVARVAADPAPVQGAGEPGAAMTSIYVRLHGSPRMYYSGYDAAALNVIEGRLREYATRSNEVWCIFDNTADFAATANALSLVAMLEDVKS
jgi:uncharacterized protein YecE (DUF72 family)